MMNKLILFSLILFSLGGCNSQKESKQKPEPEVVSKPNVLIIYPDQYRRYSAGFWSQPKYKKHVIGVPDPIVTPNIDKIATHGVVFTQAVSNFPLCSPARGMLLSGMYPEQNGIWNNCRQGRDESLRDDIPAITDLFYQSGYNTSYFGKCHWLVNEPLFDEKGTYVGTTEAPGGHYINSYDTYIPPGKPRHNIEYFYQAIKDKHYDPLVYSNDANTIEGKKDGEMHRPKIFTPKNEAEKIINYLKNENGLRDNSKPFFMMWSLNPPHNPWDEANTDMEVLNDYYSEKDIPEIKTLARRENVDYDLAKTYVRNYFANITSVDKYIGLVIKQLEDMGALDNTIVILSSDHGEMLASHGRQGKNAFETESLTVPFIVHWPKGLEGGKISDVLFSVPDVLPTTMGLAGLKNKIPETIQGIDFSGILTHPENKTFKEPEGVLIMLSKARGIQTKQYTLCVNTNGAKKDKSSSKISKKGYTAYLYDNINDPYQFKKIPINEKPELAKKLLKLLGKELKRTNDPWFKKEKYKDIIIYPSV